MRHFNEYTGEWEFSPTQWAHPAQAKRVQTAIELTNATDEELIHMLTNAGHLTRLTVADATILVDNVRHSIVRDKFVDEKK